MGMFVSPLRFPHTFYVVAALILFLGAVACVEMPTDIFPEINIPVVTVIWSYTGLSTPEDGASASPPIANIPSARTSPASGNIEAQTLAGLSGRRSISSPTSTSTSHRPDRLGHQRHSRVDAARDPAAAGGPIQRFERAGAADQPQLGHAQRTTAL